MGKSTSIFYLIKYLLRKFIFEVMCAIIHVHKNQNSSKLDTYYLTGNDSDCDKYLVQILVASASSGPPADPMRQKYWKSGDVSRGRNGHEKRRQLPPKTAAFPPTYRL